MLLINPAELSLQGIGCPVEVLLAQNLSYIMDVQKNNFLEALEVFRESIGQCSAVALDLEFSGVRGRPELYIDSIEDRYSGLRRVASTYKIIQVGLCTFTRLENSWEARPFNFFVFPAEVPGFNQRIILEVGAINFLKEHHMDFNTWFYNGISYVNEAQAKDLENKMTEVFDDNEEMILTKTYEQVKMNEINHRIEKWLESPEETLEIPGLNAYLRRFLYTFIKKKHKNLFMDSLKTEGSRDVSIILKKASPSELLELQAKKTNDKTGVFFEKIGFRRVFSLLVDSKKPLIVHNGMLDILFTISAFQEELPENYKDFKLLANRLFPTVFDTRFLLEKIPGFYEAFDKIAPAKGLKELYRFLKDNNQTKIVLDSRFEKYYDEKYAHEAGFDAFMTGICFIIIAEKEPNIENYKNCLPLFKCFFSVKLDGEDVFSGDQNYFIKGTDSKHLFSGNEGFVFKYVKEDECFVKPLNEEKFQEMKLIVNENKLACMEVKSYFANRKSNQDKNS